MSEMTAKPQTPALPVGKGPEARKTVPSRKLLGLSHLKLQDTEEGLGHFSGVSLPAAQSSWLFAEPPVALGFKRLQTGSILVQECKETPQALS